MSPKIIDIKACMESNLGLAGIAHSPQILDHLEVYSNLILEYIGSLGLLSKVSPKREVVKQITDCAMLTRFVTFEPGCRLVDIGGGAGLPGIVLKIFRPEIYLISVDCNPRIITFQEKALKMLGMDNYECHPLQFQEYHPERKADYITSKGLGKFKKMLTLAKDILRIEGKLIFFTGDEIPRELRAIEGSPFIMESQISYNLPDYPGNLRFVIIRKTE